MLAHPMFRGLVIATVATAALSACGRSISSADLEVRVYDERTGAPIEGAEVEVGYRQAATNAFGVARLQLPTDSYPVKVRHARYVSRSSMVLLYSGALAVKTMHLPPRREAPRPEPSPSPSAAPGASPAPALSPLPRPTPIGEVKATVFGHVKDQTGKRIAKATVFVESTWGVPFGMAETDANGDYEVTGLPRRSEVRITAIADGFKPRVRSIRPIGKTQVDFVGAYGLKADAGGVSAATVQVTGTVEDTRGRALDGVVIKAESHDAQTPYLAVAIARQGAFELEVPVGQSVRFTAGKEGYRSVTFVRELGAGDRRVDFTGLKGLGAVSAFEAEDAE